jgi:RNA polymerase sigma-70 factor (ECF subfamily)
MTVEHLFRSHVDDVYRVVARLLGPGAPRADVEDLTQQVFLTAHRALPRYRGEGKPMTWLYGIAARVVMGHRRSRARQRRLHEAFEAEPSRADGGNPEADAARAQALARAWEHLMAIAPKKRTVYVLHELEGVPGAEIAQALGIPEATVWTRLYHARRELAAVAARPDAAEGR